MITWTGLYRQQFVTEEPRKHNIHLLASTETVFSGCITFSVIKFFPRDVEWVWGVATVNWESMRVSRPWASLARGSFDAQSSSLFIWKMTAVVQILKQVEMTAAELNVTRLCLRCSLSCVISQVKQLPHLHIITLSICGCYALQRVFWNSLETKLTSTKVMFL